MSIFTKLEDPIGHRNYLVFESVKLNLGLTHTSKANSKGKRDCRYLIRRPFILLTTNVELIHSSTPHLTLKVEYLERGQFNFGSPTLGEKDSAMISC